MQYLFSVRPLPNRDVMQVTVQCNLMERVWKGGNIWKLIVEVVMDLG
jgi:hypothetical protein